MVTLSLCCHGMLLASVYSVAHIVTPVQVRKTAMREVRILKMLKHEHLVSLLEVFRRKGKLVSHQLCMTAVITMSCSRASIAALPCKQSSHCAAGSHQAPGVFIVLLLA